MTTPRRPRPGGWRQLALAGLAGIVVPAMGALPAAAQEAPAAAARFAAPQILTLDQERLFTETLYGKRLAAEIEQVTEELAQRNRDISADLAAEEKDLTERRKQLSAQDFRPLAEAFDQKVIRLREEQDAKIVALQRQRDQERRDFSARVMPILQQIVAEVGGLAILDQRAVILSAEQIDVTDRAIARIDELIGDGAQFGPATDAEGAAGDQGTGDAGAPPSSGPSAGQAPAAPAPAPPPAPGQNQP